MTQQQQHDLQAALERIDLRQLAAQHWGPGRTSGRAVLYRSPWRAGDERPSFAVYADGYKDFGGDGEAGSTFDWIMRQFRLDRGAAARWVLDEAGLTRAPRRPVRQPAISAQPAEEPDAAWETALEATCAAAQVRLWSPAGRAALAYLRRERGLSEAVIRAAGLGYCAAWTDTGAVIDGRPVRLAPGVILPWRVDGRLVAVRVRTRTGAFARALGLPDDRGADGAPLDKYLSARGSHLRGAWYAAPSDSPARAALLVEGEFDALVAACHLPSVTALTFGSASSVPTRLSAEQTQALASFSHIHALLDADAAGQAATARLREALGPRLHILSLPDGHKDLSDYAQSGADLAAWFRHQTAERLPDTWLSALLLLTDADGLHKGTAAPVYALLLEAIGHGDLDGQAFTLRDLQQSQAVRLHAPGEGLLRSGLRLLAAAGLLVQQDLLRDSDTQKDPDCVSKTAKKVRGRPDTVYRLVPYAERRAALERAFEPLLRQMAYPAQTRGWQEAALTDFTPAMLADAGVDAAQTQAVNARLAPAQAGQRRARRQAGLREQRLRAQFDLEDPTHTPLPDGWPLGTLENFRVAYLRALKLAGRIGCAQSEIALRLGISRPKVNDYVRAAGYAIETGQRASVRLTADREVSRQVRAGAGEVGGRPLALRVNGVQMAYSEHSAAHIIAPALAQGGQVEVIYQVANRHTPLPDARPPERRCRRKARISKASPLPVSAGKEGSGMVGDLPTSPPDPLSVHGQGRRASAEVRLPDKVGQAGEVPRRPGYSPAWVRDQLALGLRLLGWRQPDGRFLNPDTGEIAPSDASAPALVALLTGG